MKDKELVVRLANAAEEARLREDHELAELLDEAEEELERALAIVEKAPGDEACAFMDRHSLGPHELSAQERQVLRHTLTGSSGTDEVYRNYFAASPGHHDMQAITRLVMVNLMRVGNEIPGGESRYYHCTAAGAKAVGLHMPLDMRVATSGN